MSSKATDHMYKKMEYKLADVERGLMGSCDLSILFASGMASSALPSVRVLVLDRHLLAGVT